MAKRTWIALITVVLCFIISVAGYAGSLEFGSYATKGDRFVEVKIKNANKGDRVVLQYGNKRDTCKFKRGRAKYYFRMKTPKLKVGRKINAIMYNAQGQVIAKARDIVYFRHKLKKGMTMVQVKHTPFYRQYYYTWSQTEGEREWFEGRGEPDKITSRPQYHSVEWFWESDEAILDFVNGKLDYAVYYRQGSIPMDE